MLKTNDILSISQRPTMLDDLVARVMSNNRDREHISMEVQSVVENSDE